MSGGLFGGDVRDDDRDREPPPTSVEAGVRFDDSGERGLEVADAGTAPPGPEPELSAAAAGSEDSGDPGLEVDGFNGPTQAAAAAAPDRPASASATPVTVGTGEPDVKKGPPPMFDTLEDWVYHWLLPFYRRSLDGSAVTFCREWWRHPEAYLRLDALWKGWEFMRRKPGPGMSIWLKDHLDHHMLVLMREQGTFKGCTVERHNHQYALAPWELAPMPTELQIARLYSRMGLKHTYPTGGPTDMSVDELLASVRAQEWDGVDRK